MLSEEKTKSILSISQDIYHQQPQRLLKHVYNFSVKDDDVTLKNPIRII